MTVNFDRQTVNFREHKTLEVARSETIGTRPHLSPRKAKIASSDSSDIRLATLPRNIQMVGLITDAVSEL